MSFDMAGSLTSTPTHAGLATSGGGGGYPPTAQSTPVTSLQPRHASLLTTPNLAADTSGHSTPKTMYGRLFTMVYALFGIPLGLVLFNSIGRQSNFKHFTCNLFYFR